MIVAERKKAKKRRYPLSSKISPMRFSPYPYLPRPTDTDPVRLADQETSQDYSSGAFGTSPKPYRESFWQIAASPVLAERQDSADAFPAVYPLVAELELEIHGLDVE